MMRLLDVEQGQNILRRFAKGGQHVHGFGGEVSSLLGTIAASYAPAVVQY